MTLPALWKCADRVEVRFKGLTGDQKQLGVGISRRRSVVCPAKHAWECNSFRILDSKGFPSAYSKSVCVRLRSKSSEPTMLISQTTPDEHPRTPPPWRWPTFITFPTLTTFRLVSRRLCNAVLFRSSCLFEHTLTAVWARLEC